VPEPRPRSGTILKLKKKSICVHWWCLDQIENHISRFLAKHCRNRIRRRNMAKKILTLVSLISFCLFAQVGLANALTVKLNPASVDLNTAGATFDIDVLIEDVTDFGGFQFSIDYNPAIVTVENAADVVLGPFLGSTGRGAIPVGPTIDNVAGKITYGAFTMGAAPPGPSGNGLLATITFTVQSQANGLLDLNAVQITDIAGVPLTVDTVGDSNLIGNAQPIPTLSEWGMIIMALLMGGSGLYLMQKKKAFKIHT
jgi:hypothetical protein